MSNPSVDFDKQINAFADKVQKRLDVFVQEFLVRTGEKLIDDSPVVTGRLKAHWHITVNPEGDSADPDRKDPIGAVTKGDLKRQAAGVKAGNMVYLINNVFAPENDPGGAGPYAYLVHATPIRYGHVGKYRPASQGFANMAIGLQAQFASEALLAAIARIP